MQIRQSIFRKAARLPEVGRLEEALRWGQPACLTVETGAGSALRLGIPKSGGFALYVNCRTSLIADFRPMAPADMRFEGSRAVLFEEGATIDPAAISWLIARALTYHLRGK